MTGLKHTSLFLAAPRAICHQVHSVLISVREMTGHSIRMQ
jgi:hypothetical protein